MTVRRPLPFLLAALLGVGAGALAACGSSGDRGIPAASANNLKREINDVREAVDDNRCEDVSGQVRQVDEGIDDLPPEVDTQLLTSLRDGANRLLSAAREECEDTPTETSTTTTETVPEETTTETLPEETQTTPPPTTTAPPPPTTTAPQPPPPPAPEPVPPPAPEPAPPPSGTPGGGVEPEIP